MLNCLCLATLKTPSRHPFFSLGLDFGIFLKEPDPGVVKDSCRTNPLLDLIPVLPIRDVYPGSEFFSPRIQGQKDSGSRGSGTRIIEFKYF